MGNFEERQQLRSRIDNYKEKLNDVYDEIKEVTNHLDEVYSALEYMYGELERVKSSGYSRGHIYNGLIGSWKRDIENTKGEAAYYKEKRNDLYKKVRLYKNKINELYDELRRL